MADEAKLVVELLDRSGSGGSASTNPIQPGSADIPGAGLAAEHQQVITQQGAGARAGAGSATPSPAPTIAPAASAGPTPALSASVGQLGPPTTSDPLEMAVRGVLAASPTTTAKELQDAFGLNAQRAQELLQAAKQNNAPAPAQAATPTPTGVTPIVGVTGPQERYIEPPPVVAPPVLNPPGNPAAPIPPVKDPDAITSMSPQQLTNTINQTLAPLGGLGGIGQGVGGQIGGALGQLAQTGVNAIPAIASGSIVGPAIAAAVAAAGVPTAYVAAMTNEAQRAASIAKEYSPEVAGAAAKAEIRDILADMRTAGRLGDEAAAYTDAASRISAASQNIRDIVAEPFLKDFTNLQKLTAEGLERLSNYLDEGTEQRQNRARSALYTLMGIPGFLIWGGSKLGAVLGGDDSVNPGNPFDWFDDMEHLAPRLPFKMQEGETDDIDISDLPGLKL